MCDENNHAAHYIQILFGKLSGNLLATDLVDRSRPEPPNRRKEFQ